MNRRSLLRSCRLLLLASAVTLDLTAASGSEAATFADALSLGKVSLNARLRYEGVSQSGLRDADALTLRTRLSFATAPLHGWTALLEAEHIVAADGDSYSQSGLNPGGAGRAVISDPEDTEVNQTFVSYLQGKTTATIGRQRLVLDGARFIGDVGWRQNMQTFDAVVVRNKSVGQTAFTYAYLQRINRVVGHRHAQGRWQSDSHLLNASYSGLPSGTLTGYAYLLDFDNSAVNSCATYGLSFAGATQVSGPLKATYRTELAQQRDHGSSLLNYRASYYNFEAGVAAKPGSLTLGYEVLGSNRNVGFKTPLATLHAFNGWADVFVATPAAGLRDIYLKGTTLLPGKIALTAFWHKFQTVRARTDLGTEIDVQLSRPLGKFVTAMVKCARFDRDSANLPDVRKVWAQLEFSY